MKGEGLLEEEVEADIRDTEPDCIPQALGQDVKTGCLGQGRQWAGEALFECLAGDQRAHHTQGEVEAVGCYHEQASGHRLPLHLVPDPVQGKADTSGIYPGKQDRCEIALVQLAGMVREQGVLHVLQWEHVQAEDVGDGNHPHKPATVGTWDGWETRNGLFLVLLTVCVISCPDNNNLQEEVEGGLRPYQVHGHHHRVNSLQ